MAVAEENAVGGVIVNAPTCGSCGEIPAVLYLLEKHTWFYGKKNASILGAGVACQGEIGEHAQWLLTYTNRLLMEFIGCRLIEWFKL